MTVSHEEGEKFEFKMEGNRREVVSWNYVENPDEIAEGRYYVYV